MKIYDIINESTGVTDYNPKSQGGTRKELLAKYHKTKDPKDAAAARKAGATQKELQGVAEGKFGLPEPGDMVKHVNGATGKIRKLSWMDGDTYIYFKDKNGDMNYGRWEKEVTALKKGVAETTGDPKFDKMLKGITSKKQVAKQQKTDTKQQARDAFGSMFGNVDDMLSNLKIRKKGVAEAEYDPSYDPEYRGYQKPEQDPDAWKQERDTADDSESNSIVYIIDTNTDEVVLRFKSTGEFWGDIKHALKHGYDTDSDRYDIKWKRKEIKETATAGSTSAGNVGVGAVYKNKPAKQAKNKDGTAKNALDMNANLLTGGGIKR